MAGVHNGGKVWLREGQGHCCGDIASSRERQNHYQQPCKLSLPCSPYWDVVNQRIMLTKH